MDGTTTGVSNLLRSAQSFVERVDRNQVRYNSLQGYRESLLTSLTSIQSEQELLERSRAFLLELKKSITKSSLEQCESLANMALSVIFDSSDTVRYDTATSKFILNKGSYEVDLVSGEGGGILTVISFVFSVYLIMKTGARRMMMFDEQFTQISDQYLPKFVGFLRYICKELSFDILWATHDERITLSDVDHAYVVSEGTANRIK